MARCWTPRRVVALRCVRVAVVASVVCAVGAAGFGIGARKTVALEVNGETRQVTTYAMSVDRLLQQEGIHVRSHDLVQSTSGGTLTNHAVVTVRSAYQATVTIDGQRVPFWTVATSASQLLGFFDANEHDASRVTVDVGNVYNQLTGGLVINRDGPVTVIADGKTSVAPDGRLPAASILDSKGIVVGKDDRVSVSEEDGRTILRVQRVTHGQETRTVSVPFATRTVVDPSLEPGQTVIRQQGQEGQISRVFNVTYVDGKAESETLDHETTVRVALDRVVAVGPEPVKQPEDEGGDDAATSGKDATAGKDAGKSQSGDKDSAKDTGGKSDQQASSPKPSTPSQPSKPAQGSSGSQQNNQSQQKPSQGSSGNSGGQSNGSNGSNASNGAGNQGGSTSQPAPQPTPSGLWRPSPAAAQTYAADAAAQYGWNGQKWTDLVNLWNRESSWRWNAQNPSSGAYGIPQSLPGDKMAAFGANWRDDAAIQINWGLNYIAQRYGSPSAAWRHSEQVGWY